MREVMHERKRNPLFDLCKFYSLVDMPVLIVYAEDFGVDRLRGLGLAGIKFCPSC